MWNINNFLYRVKGYSLFLLVPIISACATATDDPFAKAESPYEDVSPYKEYGKGYGTWGFMGGGSGVGYKDRPIGPNQYEVVYIGSLGVPIEYSIKNVKRRALEVCQENGFSSYKLLENMKTSEAYSGTGSSMTTGLTGTTTSMTTPTGQTQGTVLMKIECTN